MRASSFCAVILAAGSSSRMGREKALLPWPPETSGTLLGAHIERLLEYSEMVLVVAGANAAALAPLVDAAGAFLVRNPQPERGQFSSLQTGLQEVLNRGRDAAFIAPVDRPPASAATLQQLRETFLASDPRPTWAVVPEHGGRHGHPIVAGREMMEAFLRAPVSSTARDIEHAAQPHILYLAVEDPMIVANLDTPEQYAQLCQAHTS